MSAEGLLSGTLSGIIASMAIQMFMTQLATYVAKESTLQQVKSKTDRLTFDEQNNLLVKVSNVEDFRKVIKEELHTISVLADLSNKVVLSGVDVLENDLIVDFMGWVRIQIIPSYDTKVEVKINGSYGFLNEGGLLYANNIYEFDVTVAPNDTINFRLTFTSAPSQTIKLFRIMKVVV